MKTSEQINELATALAAVQGAMEPARMNAINPFLKNKYADLNSVIDSIKHLLAENGLSYVQMPNTPPIEYGPAIGLTTRLMHSSGQWIEETYTMPMPSEERGKSMMQVAGSAISYARRYALSAMLGIVADEDSDGNGSQDRGRNVTKNPPNAEKNVQPGATNGHKPTVTPAQQKPSEDQMKALHAAGSAFYGDAWDEQRGKIVKYVSEGRITSSKHLTLDEWQKAIDGIKAKADAAA